MDIQKQIVVTRARGNYMSEDKDKIDSQMHFESADTMEAMLKVVKAAETLIDISDEAWGDDWDTLEQALSNLEQP